ncbi:MAG TPA: hypothetical protein VLL52_13250 [Anaerolineae bacterium]|nr:hypothetical protein [Anaerolineae bacterium]
MENEKRLEILQLLSMGQIDATEAATRIRNLKQTADTPSTDTTPSPPPSPPAPVAPPPPTTPPAPPPHPSPPQTIPVTDETPPPNNNNQPTWLRINVKDGAGNDKINIRIPIHTIQLGLKLGARLIPELNQINWQELNHLLQDAPNGTIIEAEDHQQQEALHIFFE